MESGEWTENDEELGQVQFQLRMYSPVLGRWLSVDPARQYASPYEGMGNNPVMGVDPDGKFEVPVHVNITYAAAGRLGIPVNSVALKSLEAGNILTDYLGFAFEFHFDNMNGLGEIIGKWDQINARLSTTTSFLEAGHLFHTMQDFYAHSNYVISYVDWFAQNNDLSLPESVPIFSEALKNPSFMKYLEENGLKTGEFEVKKFVWLEKILGKSMGPDSRQWMNLDDGEGYLGGLAVDAAIRQTQEAGQKVLENRQ